MDSTWQATVHGVTKSQTRLSDFHFENTVRACQDVAVKGPPHPPTQGLVCIAGQRMKEHRSPVGCSSANPA